MSVQPATDPLEALVLDLLEWIGTDARSYSEVLEAWRTSCPRLPVWEEANARGFLGREYRAGTLMIVSTEAGRSELASRRRNYVDDHGSASCSEEAHLSNRDQSPCVDR